jgi:hypothetical protein
MALKHMHMSAALKIDRQIIVGANTITNQGWNTQYTTGINKEKVPFFVNTMSSCNGFVIKRAAWCT